MTTMKLIPMVENALKKCTNLSGVTIVGIPSAKVSFENGFTAKSTQNLERLKAIDSVPIVGKHNSLKERINPRSRKVGEVNGRTYCCP